MPSKEDNLRFRVYKFYSDHIDKGKYFTALHFKNEGVAKSTIYSILRRCQAGQDFVRKVGSGRKPKIMVQNKLKQVELLFNNSCSISIRQAARKFSVSKSYVHRIVNNKLKLKYRKKISIPSRSEKQINLAKTKCGRLYRFFGDKQFILDDESYFTLTHSSINGNDGFYTKDVSGTPATVKFSKKAKFEQKVLVWIAIGPQGMSQCFIRKSGYAITAKRYLNECIKRRLIPYIHSNYTEGEYVFWPDQASAHYAKIVIDYLKAENIEFVDKHLNAACVPEIRAIEDFWSYLKSLVYAKGWHAKTLKQLITRIKYCLKKVDRNVVQRLAISSKKRIDIVRRHGVIETRD